MGRAVQPKTHPRILQGAGEILGFSLLDSTSYRRAFFDITASDRIPLTDTARQLSSKHMRDVPARP